ncbi:hypothetical protein EDEG_02728 [Edhazardia aedis USNM 41457]|uniref:Uncharacterized protein n=1 Tax=Edhazardia aedis (strain USNM 41457) TaxID=1003232 RepID=J9D5S8_EDHAE|nr:hypothetical protein EDEG_02728 [Edhazardia aedis USNM 41457]|eukprot:EJW02904.1 hypothetical protein EDEG_02728 [Edhazardia aedis USNM 41457]
MMLVINFFVCLHLQKFKVASAIFILLYIWKHLDKFISSYILPNMFFYVYRFQTFAKFLYFLLIVAINVLKEIIVNQSVPNRFYATAICILRFCEKLTKAIQDCCKYIFLLYKKLKNIALLKKN